jgi:hypothetical protein
MKNDVSSIICTCLLVFDNSLQLKKYLPAFPTFHPSSRTQLYSRRRNLHIDQMASSLALLLLVATSTIAQSIEDYGSSGGTGPKGGIGDKNRPVLFAQAFITDGNIAADHLDQDVRDLANSPPPLLNIPDSMSCNQKRKVVVDDSAAGMRQEMLGFGHAWTDSTVSVFNSLELDVLEELMGELFGPGQSCFSEPQLGILE